MASGLMGPGLDGSWITTKHNKPIIKGAPFPGKPTSSTSQVVFGNFTESNVEQAIIVRDM